ncbi:hypothetical protein BOTBODRAFT_575756 [Botryobasidium botryosum FD-172 SS1]|uniref:Uncharacterized protein n=1 Tax=Botryobasidium botryosum (strain FD-172 SS1) TaxID=930990 RepID=A0A067MS07_BOTB1|nr:hypothetical protein BOTBODRAFT_575756 [Botryobasidium botryosum FD-172 SS1]
MTVASSSLVESAVEHRAEAHMILRPGSYVLWLIIIGCYSKLRNHPPHTHTAGANVRLLPRRACRYRVDRPHVRMASASHVACTDSMRRRYQEVFLSEVHGSDLDVQ